MNNIDLMATLERELEKRFEKMCERKRRSSDMAKSKEPNKEKMSGEEKAAGLHKKGKKK